QREHVPVEPLAVHARNDLLAVPVPDFHLRRARHRDIAVQAQLAVFRRLKIGKSIEALACAPLSRTPALQIAQRLQCPQARLPPIPPPRCPNVAPLRGAPLSSATSILPTSTPSSSVLLAKQIAASACANCPSISRRLSHSRLE